MVLGGRKRHGRVQSLVRLFYEWGTGLCGSYEEEREQTAGEIGVTAVEKGREALFTDGPTKRGVKKMCFRKDRVVEGANLNWTVCAAEFSELC
ncbi:16039_t:CDS:2 [Acaulospora colombiana]|uniref:16039_t:CDS:1 n=1 Tax=Acaulospora colombiana TaxID=27376 RepID=A0ACA9PQN8_9GLOM|nr:16039_t:CDS:2 [Acaulospora colombiana]